MTKEVKKIADNEYEIVIEIPLEKVTAAVEKAAHKLGESITLPGFRPGKAPSNLVITAVGEDKIKQEALEYLLAPHLLPVLKEEELLPIITPQVDELDFEIDKPLTFTTKVTTFPDIKITGYQGIKVKKAPEKQITDQAVEDVVNNLFKQVEQPVERDNFMLDSKGEKLVLGEAKAPTLDDDFAKKVGASDLGDLKTKIKDNLEAETRVNQEREFETSILEELVKKTKVNIPESVTQVEIDNILRKIVMDLNSLGMKFEDYMTNQKKTIEQLRQEYRASAIKTITAQFALGQLAKEENLLVTDEEVDQAMPKEEAGHTHSASEKAQMEAVMSQRKALEWLKDRVTAS